MNKTDLKEKINLRNSRYIIPSIALPFVILIGFLIKDMAFMQNKDTVVLQETEDINIVIPEANLQKKETNTKFGALQNAYKKTTDFSSIQNIEKEEKNDDLLNTDSLYSSDEMRIIDSINQVTRLKEEELFIQQERYRSQNFFENQNNNNTIERELPEKSRMQEEMELFKAQMAYLDSLQNPKPIDPPVIEKEYIEVEQPIEVVKANNDSQKYFHTLTDQDKNYPIAAILDETVKVRDGSRIRIRLLDDIMIGEILITKGSYIFGNVNGFKSQRVNINITSILVGNKRLKVDLVVYDNDGQEGFYVPSSKFRDLSRDIGGQIQGQSIQIDQQAQGIESFAFGALQDMYRSTTQAVSKSIKQNKATLKYNSHVYIINNKEKGGSY